MKLFTDIVCMYIKDKLYSFPAIHEAEGFRLMESRDTDHYVSEEFPSDMVVQLGKKFIFNNSEWIAWAAYPGYILAEHKKVIS